MKINAHILAVALLCIGTALVWREATKSGEISGLNEKIKILQSVACRHPSELEVAIIRSIKSIKKELHLKQSIVELRSLYSIGCPENISSASGIKIFREGHEGSIL
jgi:hypothetical protein